MEIPENFNPTNFDTSDKFSADRGDILDYFPKGETPRENQDIILKKYEELSKSYDDIIISDPVGGGKSFSAYTIANRNNPSYIVTTTLGLQDQYTRTLDVGDWRGRSNFKCQKLIDNAPEKLIKSIHLIKDYKKNNLTADKQECTTQVGDDIISCKYKDDDCGYHIHLRAANAHPVTVTNYPLFLISQLLNYNRRDYVVFDEAHSLADEIVKFVGVTITNKIMTDCGVFWSYEKCTLENVISFLKNIHNEYGHILKIIENDDTAYPELNKEDTKHLHVRLELIKRNIQNDSDNFVCYIKKDNYGKKQLYIKPLDLTKYTKRFLSAKKQTFLSGTIDKKYFCQSIGMNPDDFGIIEIPKSSFSKEARKIIFRNITPMSQRWIEKHPEDLVRMYNGINKILIHHKNQRGLIHTSSKEHCENIIRNLSTENKKRITIIHSNNLDGLDRNEILGIHAKSPNSVLLSSSMWTGYDFKDDLARFQIIHKFPLADWGDPWVKVKCRIDRRWYYHNAIVKTLQGFGRIVRNENDYGATYCLDSKIQEAFDTHPSMIPKSFEDVISDSDDEDDNIDNTTGLDEFFWS